MNPLDIAHRHALEFLDTLAQRRVGAPVDFAEMVERLDAGLLDGPRDAAGVVAELIERAEPGIVATTGPRYFGFVTGGAIPAALAADWVCSTWDQNAAMAVMSPAAAAAEEVVRRWLVDLLALPPDSSLGIVTGGQAANSTCLGAARHWVLERAGWDVEADGLHGAPRIHVLVGRERHATIDTALRYIGLGTSSPCVVEADGQGRMRPDDLADKLHSIPDDSPIIVCAQAGNVNSGAFDPFDEICDLAHARSAWVHIDGAFGLWAAAAPGLSHLMKGGARADSWAVDGHKWLNVPYDCGLAFTAHPRAHRDAFRSSASYYVQGAGERDGFDWVPEASRRARAFVLWAALQSLGRRGTAELIERCCRAARHTARRLREVPGVEVLNDVVLNQVLVRFGDDDDMTREVISNVQNSGILWAGGSVWGGRAVMRISVSNWSTTEADIDRAVSAIVAGYDAAGSTRRRPPG